MAKRIIETSVDGPLAARLERVAHRWRQFGIVGELRDHQRVDQAGRRIDPRRARDAEPKAGNGRSGTIGERQAVAAGLRIVGGQPFAAEDKLLQSAPF